MNFTSNNTELTSTLQNLSAQSTELGSVFSTTTFTTDGASDSWNESVITPKWPPYILFGCDVIDGEFKMLSLVANALKLYCTPILAAFGLVGRYLYLFYPTDVKIHVL